MGGKIAKIPICQKFGESPYGQGQIQVDTLPADSMEKMVRGIFFTLSDM